MYLDQILGYADSFPNASAEMPFGDDVLVYKVGGKMFLLIRLVGEPLRINVKCDPDRAMDLREHYVAVEPGFHMNKKHWNTIVLGSDMPIELVRKEIDHSYELVSKKAKKSINKKTS